MINKIKISIFLVLVGSIFISSCYFALAQTVSAPNITTSTAATVNNPEIQKLNKEIDLRKDKIKQLEETITKYKANISQKQTEGVSLKNQLNIIQNRIAQAQADVDYTSEKLQKTQLEIDVLNVSIGEKQTTIDREKKMVAKIVQSLHANDQKNFLEIMLTNSNFADFYNQAKYLQDIYIDLGRSVQQVRLIKEDLDKQKLVAEARKKEYGDLLTELDNKKEDLDGQKGNKQILLAETRNSELRYKTLLDSLRQQYKVTESEVQSFEAQMRKKLDDEERFKKVSGGDGFGWPTTGRYVTAIFHDPDYPFKNVFQHSGADIRTPQGSPIYASNSGYVGRAKRCTLASCYSYILIIHNGNLSTLYGHMSKILVSDEQYVTKGDLIGYSGGTPGMVGSGPFVTGAHLHFEVRANGIPVDPMGYLP